MIEVSAKISSKDLTFTPENFDSVISLGELTNLLTEIILELRNNDQYGQAARAAVDELERLAAQGFSLNDRSSAVLQLFNIYKQIIKVSMELRRLLSEKGLKLDVYDGITYAIYYNNERWFSETISPDWLRVTNDGALKLNVNKAVEDIRLGYNSMLNNRLKELFDNHYQSYSAAIWGMYKGGSNGRLNDGHVAEAFESHLASHHSSAYGLLNRGADVISMADWSAMLAAEGEITAAYWASHESPDDAWIHVRGSLGTQRGTVAGDVGKMQVKQSKHGDQVRLTTLANLKAGIARYTAIFGDKPAAQVARQIAMYMSENVPKTEKNIQAYAANEILDSLRNI